MMKTLLDNVHHRPWPLPQRPWRMAMVWHDLLFAHWPVPVAALRPLIPPALEIDTFDGQAWLGVVPFHMSGVRARLAPAIPGLSAFGEINVRTYVTRAGRPGVWFFSLDAHNSLAVLAARRLYNLPYFKARIAHRRDGQTVHYASRRTHRNAPPANWIGRYRPTSAAAPAGRDTLPHFLTERYCLYAASPQGTLFRADIHHVLWPLCQAEWEPQVNEMTQQIGVTLPDTPPLLHFAERLDVVAWPLQPVE